MIEGAALRDWVRGLEPAVAGRAVVGLGVDFGMMGQASADLGLRADLALSPRPWLLDWELTEERFRHAAQADPAAVGSVLGDDVPVRFAVSADALPGDVLPWLLAAPGTQSAFVAVDRPLGSLRRRPWRWPLRIGVLGSLADVQAVRHVVSAGPYPSQLADLRAVEREPGAVDVLVLEGALDEATAVVQRLGVLANAVVVLATPANRWPVVSAQLSLLRTATAAVASAVVTAPSLPELMTQFIFHASHADPFDVALTRAAQGKLLLCAEPDAMRISGLDDTTRRTVGDLRRALTLSVGSSLSMGLPNAAAGPLDVMETVADGEFRGESHEATVIAGAMHELEAALKDVAPERWLQARLGDRPPRAAGRVDVGVFIGEPEAGAAIAPAPLDESSLPWAEQEAEAFSLTVALVPLSWPGEVERRELLLPRFGRTGEAWFALDVPPGEEASARLVVLFRNRILQTAVLTVRSGAPLSLTDVTAVTPVLAHLDDRRPFDAALIANHMNGAGTAAAISGASATIADPHLLTRIAADIANTLAQAVLIRVPKAHALRGDPARKLLVELANQGRDLYNAIERELTPLVPATRIQIVTASAHWFLPLEVAYGRYAPDDDAKVCANYLADPASCTGACPPSTDRSVICPNAFWGLSKTIERQHVDGGVDAPAGGGARLLGVDAPATGDRDLVIDRVLLAASTRVTPPSVKAALATFGPRASTASSWNAWASALGADDTQLLVLLPHTDYRRPIFLEISKDKLTRGHIEAEYVTGARDIKPVVVLFGCRTSGEADDPMGFAARFRSKGARVVFHSSTDLLNVHATALAQRLVGRLLDATREPEMVSEAQTVFRREAVRDGYLAALGVAALGDADWRI